MPSNRSLQSIWTEYAPVAQYEVSYSGMTTETYSLDTLRQMVYGKPTLKERRDSERASLIRVLHKGSSYGDVQLFKDRRGRIVVMGSTINNERKLFTLSDTKLVAQRGRTKHILPLLKDLAEKEGVELILQETPPLVSGKLKAVFFVSFAGTTDDSELVSKIELAVPQDRPDCTCEECWCSGCDNRQVDCECDIDW